MSGEGIEWVGCAGSEVGRREREEVGWHVPRGSKGVSRRRGSEVGVVKVC